MLNLPIYNSTNNNSPNHLKIPSAFTRIIAVKKTLSLFLYLPISTSSSIMSQLASRQPRQGAGVYELFTAFTGAPGECQPGKDLLALGGQPANSYFVQHEFFSYEYSRTTLDNFFQQLLEPLQLNHHPLFL